VELPSPDNPARPGKRENAVGVAGLALAIPGALASLLQLANYFQISVPSAFNVVVRAIPVAAWVGILLLGSGLLAVRYRGCLRRLRMLDCGAFLARRWTHSSQADAQRAYPFYRDVFRREFRRRRLPAKAIAKMLRQQGLRVPVAAIQYFMDHLEVLPQPVLVECLERALLLPASSFARGFRCGSPTEVSLPDELCRRRLRWYAESGLARHVTIVQIYSATPRGRLALHKQIEQHLLDELDGGSGAEEGQA